ncbi:MAG: sulfotransferase domain-containing protein [Acidobacteria bacterium]|nr:sulfotransferase domain-containing protein [Acidobacteriota bacterium]
MGRSKQAQFGGARKEFVVSPPLADEFQVAIAKLQQGDAEASLILLKGLLHQTRPSPRNYDEIVQVLATAYKRRIDKLVRERADDIVISSLLQEAVALELRGDQVQSQDARNQFADTFHHLALIFSRNHQYSISLPILRKAIGIHRCPTYYVSLTNALASTKERARLEDFTSDYKPEALGKHIFIACAPKSGSTFLKNVLVAATKFRPIFSVFAALQNEHDLDLPVWLKFGTENTVTQQHCRASEANIQLMQAFGIKPIILVRNIYDTVVSLRDFYRTGFTETTYFSRDDFDKLSEERQADLIIDNVLPWYFQFFSSWQRAEADNRLEVHWLSYQELINNKTGTVEQLLQFYGLKAERGAIKEVIATTEADARRNRFNKGIVGRGITLAAQQRKRIAKLAEYYPSTDFTSIGL